MKILYAGDTPTVETGFGIVAQNLLSRLHDRGHDIRVLGVNHFGDPYDHKEFPYMIYPTFPGSPDSVFGFHRLWEIARGWRPDLIFFLNDPWLIHDYMLAKPENPLPEHTKIIAYYPTDGGPLKPDWIETLNSLDAQICYSHYAEKVVTESNKGIRPENMHQLYHGVNTEVFKPVSQSTARQLLGLPVDAFIVGMVARNQFRKRFDIMMAGFTEFAKNKQNVKLYLHTALKDIGFDIADLARQFNLGDKLILTEGIEVGRGVSPDRLNLIYNCLDIHCLISLGDGFGLPVAESMAVGCPQIVSDHSCLKELVDGHGGLTVKNAAWLANTSGMNTWGGLSDYKHLAEQLNTLYIQQERRRKLGEAGFNFIRQEQFTWDFAADKLEGIIRQIFHMI